MKRNGDECVYTKEETLRLAPIPAVYVCDPVEGYGPGRLNGRTCTYTRSGSTTLPAKVTKRYRCPSAPATFKFSRIDDIRSKCLYTRSGETTRLKQWIPMYGYVGPCPKAPATFTYSKREGITCYYTRSTSTERGYEEYETYTCPPAPDTYTPAGRTGKTCKYTRSTSTTKPATRKTISRCPPVPSGYRWGHRSGNDCYYNMTVTETKPARGTTTYSCRSNENLVGTKCQKPRSGGTTTTRVYDCPAARTGETLTKSGSGKTTTCTYKKNETKTITKPPPPPPPPPAKPLATPTGIKANGDSTLIGALPADHSYKSKISWSRVPNATEYTVAYGVWTIDEYTELPAVPDMDEEKKKAPEKFWTKKKSSTNHTTITGLTGNTLYIIRILADSSNSRYSESEWSKPIYTYPTAQSRLLNDTLPPRSVSRIGINYLIGFRPATSFNYRVCTNNVIRDYSKPPTHSVNGAFQIKVAKQLDQGILTWQTATDRMVTTKRTSLRLCDPKTIGNSNAIIVPPELDALIMLCNLPIGSASANVLACVPRAASSQIATGRRIYINRDQVTVDTIKDDKSLMCSRLFRIAMHEAGHIFGLGDVPGDKDLPVSQRRRTLQSSWDNKTVMWMSKDELCAPTEYDTVAMKAVYQSR